MNQVPTTVQQVAALVFLVLPGVTYQFLREKWRGPVPAEQDLGERILRAVVASIVLNTTYAVIAGPWLVKFFQGSSGQLLAGTLEHPRQSGLLMLALLVVAPGIAAFSVSKFERRRRFGIYRQAPSAWDYAFRGTGACFIRAKLDDGSWVGGWYGSRSLASSYPGAGEVFLEAAYEMFPDGKFGPRVRQTAGLYIRIADIKVLEFLEIPSQKESK